MTPEEWADEVDAEKCEWRDKDRSSRLLDSAGLDEIGMREEVARVVGLAVEAERERILALLWQEAAGTREYRVGDWEVDITTRSGLTEIHYSRRVSGGQEFKTARMPAEVLRGVLMHRVLECAHTTEDPDPGKKVRP